MFDTGRDLQEESRLVQAAIDIVQRPKRNDFSSIRGHMQRCRIAVAVRNGVDDLATLVAL